jgi:hypothetical protein
MTLERILSERFIYEDVFSIELECGDSEVAKRAGLK